MSPPNANRSTFMHTGSPGPQLVLNGLVSALPRSVPASVAIWRQVAGQALQLEMRQAQQWIYFGKLDAAERDEENLLDAVLALAAALPRYNPRILPSLSPGEDSVPVVWNFARWESWMAASRRACAGLGSAALQPAHPSQPQPRQVVCETILLFPTAAFPGGPSTAAGCGAGTGRGAAVLIARTLSSLTPGQQVYLHIAQRRLAFHIATECIHRCGVCQTGSQLTRTMISTPLHRKRPMAANAAGMTFGQMELDVCKGFCRCCCCR